MKGLFENVKRICDEQGITIPDLERKAKLSENSIYAWQRTNPSFAKVKQAADALGVKMEELVRDL